MTRFVTSLSPLLLAATVSVSAQAPAPAPPAPGAQPAQAPLGPNQWRIDASHSAANFSVRHLMVSTVRGQLGPITGTIEYDGKDVRTVKADVEHRRQQASTRRTRSATTTCAARLLRRREHPTITFKSKRVEPGSRRRVQADWRPDDSRHDEGSRARRRSAVAGREGHARHGHRHDRDDPDQAARVWAKVQLDGRSRPVVGDEVTITIDLEIGRPSAPGTAH